MRKDVERAFGVIKSKWKIIEQPGRLWSSKTMIDVMKAVIILHNMVVEDRGRDSLCEEALADDRSSSSMADARVGGDLPKFWRMPSFSGEIIEPPPGSIAAIFAVAPMLESEKEHNITKKLLADHIWNEQSRSFRRKLEKIIYW